MLGPLMFDISGVELAPTEREYLRHPLTGGVILFDCNYESFEQLEALVSDIHSVRQPQLLVAVDQEGGRVQRFRKEFTLLPAIGDVGKVYDENRKRAKRLAQGCGWLMAKELRAVGVDLCFAPVLDLNRENSEVIGDRAFHEDPEAVADIAHSYMTGMAEGGMAATGKHFPGHGSVCGDSHLTLPVDERGYEDIYDEDLVPFERMINYGLAGIMAAHVLYPRVDQQAAGFSRFWLQDELRSRLRFQGAIFSDDLTMAGAQVAGDALDRARSALAAGCDMILICHDVTAVEQTLDRLKPRDNPASSMRLIRMHGRGSGCREDLLNDDRYQQTKRMVATIA